MEMASAHGLALKLVEKEMNRQDRNSRNELREIMSDEDRLIKLWNQACQSRFSKRNFFILMRKTIVFVLSKNSLKELKKKELLKSVSMYFNQFSVMLRNSLDIRKPLIDVIVDPWKNKDFSWDELFQKRINICDRKVQQYFNTEPEEVVCARAHFFSSNGKDDMSMILAKNSFLFHSRVAKTFKPLSKSYKTILHSNLSRKGIPSMDWYIHNLRQKKSADALYHELKQLTCDEGVLLLMRMRGLKLLPLALSTVRIYLMLELLHPSKFCCTKKLFTLWSILHKDVGTSMEDVNCEIKKLVARYAPSSSHFYLLVDALWEQFGMSYVNIYVELYIRALTTDLNNLEAAKHQGKNEVVEYLESQMSSMFYKLSTLFLDYHQRVARECMFSAFSLKPNKKTLYILQSMTSSILSDQTEMKGDSPFNNSNASVHECKCAIKCTGFCKSVKEHVLDHPILMKGIPNIPYSVVKDLVSILESVRCFRFQYNVFHWHKNDIDLGDYLKEYTVYKSYESDTECEEDNVPAADDNVSEEMSQSEKISDERMSLQSSVKRKSDSCDLKEIFPFEVVGGNIEARNEEFLNKKMKMEDQSQNISSVANDILNTHAEPSQEYTINLGMEDAIENVIRATLDNNRQKSGLSLDKSPSVLSNASFSHGNDESENLSSLYKPVSENNIYPYPLTNYGKEKNLSTRTSFTSEVESSFKYNYFPPSPSVLSRALTAPPPINRGSVISPTHHLQNNSSTGQEHSTREINQNTYLLKPVNDPYYNKSKDIRSDTVNSEKQLSVYQQQEAHNFVSKSSLYGQNRNVSNTVSQSSQYISNQTTMQIVRRSNVPSDFPKEQFLTSTPIHSTSSATPLNLTQPKPSAVQSPQYLPIAHHHASKASSILKTDSRYQAVDTVSKTTVKRVNESMSYHDNQLVHCDRSSVIQHTMQHVKESNSQIRLHEIEMPNQLAVSVNSDAVEQIRNVPKKDITNLPPFRVNVSDRSISSSSLAVSANLVIARKPQPQIEVQSQPLSSSIPPATSDTITIPGILASPSVIVSPWEAQRKVHGDMMYKKNPQGITVSSIDKRIYKNRPPYGRPVTIKSEPKILGHKLTYDKNNNSQVFKALAMASHNNPSVHTIPSTNQSNTNASQNWAAVNKSPSSQVVSQTVSSQPWYSEPYPKPHGSRNVSSTSTGNSAAIEKNTVKIFQPGIDSKSFTVHSKQMRLSKSHSMVIPTIASSLSHSTNNHVSNSSAKPNVHYVTTFAAPNPSTSAVANTAVLDKGNNVHSSSNNNTTNIRTYSSAAHKTMRNSSTASSTRISDILQLGSELTHNKNSVAYSASNIIDNNIQFSQPSPRTLQNTCCSPSELNPCQNCSLPSESNLIQTSNEKTLSDHPNNMIPRREKMGLESDVACNSSFPSIKEDKCDPYNASRLNCPHCENPFSELELQAHILNCASRNLDLKNNNLANEIGSNMLVTENFCARSLPDVVPEQNSFFQKEPFLNNLPQNAKSFMTMEDDKNLDEIDANAFSACMDLINNDKDLERIVQGIDSLDQIDNNYLPYIPPADPAEKFLSNNLCNDIQNNENPLQDSEVYGKINEVNNYNIEHGCPQLHDKELAIFDFTESVKSVQQSVFTKPQISCAETIPTTTSKVSNELSFTDVLKSILTETSPNETESIIPYESNCPSEITNEMCLKNDAGLNVDDNLGPPIDPVSPVDQTNFTYAVENVVEENMISKKAETPKRNYQYRCPICRSLYVNSNFLFKKHIPKKHPEITEVHTPASCRVYNIHNKNFKSKCFKPGRRNLYHNSTKPFNRVLDSVAKQNLPASNVSESGSSLPKGKRKRILKNPQIECKFCGKLVTTIYLRMHIRTQHPVKIENSSELNTDVSENPAIDSASLVDSVTIPSLSPLLEQDFDSSTCLSASDALKKNSSFTVTETSHNSENSDKLAEKTNVKFNFNVLEFSRDFESDSKIFSGGNLSLQTENTTLENVKHENIPFEDFNLENHFEDKNAFNDVPRTKTAECTICSKSYHNKGNLSRHMKDAHMKLPKKAKSVNKVKNSKIEENRFETYTDFQKNTDANVESFPGAAKAVSASISRELTKNEKAPNSTASFPQMKGHDYAPHPNSKGNLLKAVLRSNFAKECRLSQKISKKDNIVQDKQISVIGTSKVLEDGSKLLNENLPSTHGSLFDNVPSSNPELKSSDETLALVPFEKTSDIQTAVKSQEYSFISHNEDNNELSVSTNLSNSSLNDNSKMEENSDVKHQQVANSQNLSIQSSEISPISQIISNVSKCHFGGTSNKDNKKEVFEDNSLKLLIPDNKDMSTNVSINDLEGIDKSTEVHFVESKIYNQGNDKNNIDSEHGLNCDKSDSDMCNQKIKEELFHKKLSDSTIFSDDSDISIKKPEVTSVASLSCEEKVVEKESCDLESILQEKESCALENNTSLEKESCELKNIEPENESSKIRTTTLENESCELRNTSLENESCELRNTSLENESCELRNTSLENESCEIGDVLQEKESCKLDNMCDLQNIISENESFRPENSTHDESCELQNAVPVRSCKSENIASKNEPCRLESSFQNSKYSEIEHILPENGSHGITNSSLENNCELENSLQADKSFKNTLRKNKSSEDKILLENISELKNSLTVNEVCDLEENMLKNELCEPENASQLNDDSLVEKKSYEAENIDKKKELCELTNTSSNPNNIMCRLCQQDLDSMEILSKHLKDFHDIPVLKKHVSEHSSKKKSTHSQNIKLSPPNLKLGTNESDSESVSDFDSPQNWPKPTIDILSQGTHKNEKLSEKNLFTVPSPTKQNILDKDTDLYDLPSTLEKSFECSNKDFEVENLSSIQSLKSPLSSLNRQKVMTPLNKFRRLSLDDAGSVTPVKHADKVDEHISNKLCKSGKRKSKSLPNIKIVFPSIVPSQNECKVSSAKPLITKNIYIESSLSEDASFSSVNDSIENCKSSYDSSLSSSSSSQNNTIPLNEITINSNFILPNRVSPSGPRISPKKIILKSKLAGRKLIIQRLKKKRDKRKKCKSKHFHHKKIKSNKIFKPIIVTLKEATEVDKFLETHKQPIVKLIRLKDNEFDCLSYKKTSSISYVKSDKINMMPIVRLEKINETVLRDKEQFVPNLLQRNEHECVRSRRTVKHYRKKYIKLKNKTVSSKASQAHNLSDESIEIVDDDSSDSIQFLKTVTKEEKLKIKPDFCPTPETKPCFVVLKRDEALYHM